MSTTVSLHHVTRYRYSRPVVLSPQTIRLRPSPHCRTPILGYSLKITPENHSFHWIQDPQGNYLARVIFPAPISEFKVDVTLVAELIHLNPFDFFLEDHALVFPVHYDATHLDELAPYLKPPVDTGPRWDSFIAAVDVAPRPSIHFLVELNQRVNQSVRYSSRIEPGILTPEQTLDRQIGSCRDSTWLLVNALRHFGLAARFVSGYLIQLGVSQPDSASPQDVADLHAWTEVYLPGAGWIGLDATSGLLSGEGHIPLASSPNPVSAAPITGSAESVGTDFDFSMSVTRI
jgi:transglutaminase-like putative cysteine protease